jgi:hypothetical protein
MERPSAHRLRLMLTALLGLTLVSVLSLARVARAVEFDDDGVIGADEVIDDDVMMNAEVVVVDGTVNGNLLVSGGSVTVNGKISGDLLIFSAEATVDGQVDGNLAFCGQSLWISGAIKDTVWFLGSSLVLEPATVIGRNLFFTGFGMEAEPGSTIGRDVIASGYQALLRGQTERDVQAEVNALELGGSVGGDVRAKVGAPGEGMARGPYWPGMPQAVDAGLRVSESAEIGGALVYSSEVEQGGTIGAVPLGGVVYEPPVKPEVSVSFGQRAGQWLLARVRELVTLLVLGALAAWRLPGALNQLADTARSKPLPAAGWGIVVILLGFVGAAVLAGLILIVGILLGVVTLGGLAGATFGIGFSGLSLAFGLFMLFIMYGSKLVVAHLVGRLILQRFLPQYAERAILALTLGVALYILVRSVPVLGGLIGAIVTLLGLGAMWLLLRQRRGASPEPTQPQETRVANPTSR